LGVGCVKTPAPTRREINRPWGVERNISGPLTAPNHSGLLLTGKTCPRFPESAAFLGARASRPHLVLQQSAVVSGAFLAFLILRDLPQAGRMPALPTYRGSRLAAFQVAKIGNWLGSSSQRARPRIDFYLNPASEVLR